MDGLSNGSSNRLNNRGDIVREVAIRCSRSITTSSRKSPSQPPACRQRSARLFSSENGGSEGRLAFCILFSRIGLFRAREFFPQHLILGLDLRDPGADGPSAVWMSPSVNRGLMCCEQFESKTSGCSRKRRWGLPRYPAGTTSSVSAGLAASSFASIRA